MTLKWGASTACFFLPEWLCLRRGSQEISPNLAVRTFLEMVDVMANHKTERPQPAPYSSYRLLLPMFQENFALHPKNMW